MGIEIYEIQDIHKYPYFRKMRVESGFLYNFYDTETDNYSTKWILVPDSKCSNFKSVINWLKNIFMIVKPAPNEQGN